MVEPLLHFSVPFAALSLTGVSPRKALFAAFFALLPDIDALFHVHRSISHSVPIVLLAASPMVFVAWRTLHRGYAALAVVGVLSHLALDLFQGYTPLLWPLYDRSVWLAISSETHIASFPTAAVQASLLTRPTNFETFQTLDAPIFTSWGLSLSLMLIIPIAIRILKATNRGHR